MERTATAVEDAIRARRTHKRFGTEPLTRDEVVELLDLARYAPNHHLTQPWRFRVLGPESVARLKEAGGPKEAAKLDRAPTLVVVSARLTGETLGDEEDLLACAAGLYAVLLGAHCARPRFLLAQSGRPAHRRGARGRRGSRRRAGDRAAAPRPARVGAAGQGARAARCLHRVPSLGSAEHDVDREVRDGGARGDDALHEDGLAALAAGAERLERPEELGEAEREAELRQAGGGAAVLEPERRVARGAGDERLLRVELAVSLTPAGWLEAPSAALTATMTAPPRVIAAIELAKLTLKKRTRMPRLPRSSPSCLYYALFANVTYGNTTLTTVAAVVS